MVPQKLKPLKSGETSPFFGKPQGLIFTPDAQEIT